MLDRRQQRRGPVGQDAPQLRVEDSTDLEQRLERIGEEQAAPLRQQHLARAISEQGGPGRV